jgi:hypothetical protein
MSEDLSCMTCIFIDKSDELRPFCRRYPAQLVNQQTSATSMELRALYPVVSDKDWCGEHKMRDA